jgi:predicted DCC family thiol-disulfide oxidoreductase YuxK
VLVFDGDCGFCTSSVGLLERIGPSADIVAWQLTDLDALGLTEERAADAVQWVEVDGGLRSGHEAVSSALVAAGGIWRAIGRAMELRGVSWLAALAYRLVAENRYRLPGGTPACARRPEEGDRGRKP